MVEVYTAPSARDEQSAVSFPSPVQLGERMGSIAWTAPIAVVLAGLPSVAHAELVKSGALSLTPTGVVPAALLTLPLYPFVLLLLRTSYLQSSFREAWARSSFYPRAFVTGLMVALGQGLVFYIGSRSTVHIMDGLLMPEVASGALSTTSYSRAILATSCVWLVLGGAMLWYTLSWIYAPMLTVRGESIKDALARSGELVRGRAVRTAVTFLLLSASVPIIHGLAALFFPDVVYLTPVGSLLTGIAAVLPVLGVYALLTLLDPREAPKF